MGCAARYGDVHHGRMSTDAGLDAGRDGERSWSLVERGSFVLGRCEACGFQSPARRARFSAESDIRAHEVVCEDARQARSGSA